MKLLPYILNGSSRTGGAKSDYVFVFDIANPTLYVMSGDEAEKRHVTVEYLRNGAKTTETYDLPPAQEEPATIMPRADVNTPVRVTFDANRFECIPDNPDEFAPGFVSHVTSFSCTPHEGSSANMGFIGSYPADGVVRPKIVIKGEMPYIGITGATPEILDLTNASGEYVESAQIRLCYCSFFYINAKKIIFSKDSYFHCSGGVVSDTLEEIEAAKPFQIEESNSQVPNLQRVRLTYIPTGDVDFHLWAICLNSVCLCVKNGKTSPTGTFYINKDVPEVAKQTLAAYIADDAPGWRVVYE